MGRSGPRIGLAQGRIEPARLPDHNCAQDRGRRPIDRLVDRSCDPLPCAREPDPNTPDTTRNLDRAVVGGVGDPVDPGAAPPFGQGVPSSIAGSARPARIESDQNPEPGLPCRIHPPNSEESAIPFPQGAATFHHLDDPQSQCDAAPSPKALAKPRLEDVGNHPLRCRPGGRFRR